MTEKQLTKNICDYLKWQYKDVIFTVDTSGIKLLIGQAVQMKALRSNKGLPDLLIFEPNKYHKALFLEIKKEGTKLKKKNGNFIDERIKKQNEIINKLLSKGYAAMFVFGFDDAKIRIDDYMKCR